MDRRTMRAVAVGATGVVAVGLAAATLTATLTTEGSTGEGTGAGGSDEFAPAPPADGSPQAVVELPWLGELLYAVFALLLVCLLGYVAYDHRREAAVLVAVAIALLVTLWFLSGHVTIPIPDPAPEPPEGSGGQGLTGSGEEGVEGVETPRSPIVGLVLVALAVAGLLLAVATASTRRAADVGRFAEPDDELAAIGRAAGRAADRLGGDADAVAAADEDELDNEVYRAWREMTAGLDVERPESSTPGEFADAAVAAGMAPDDVRELTELFEAVRYGGRGATDDRERRARRLFRRIEAAYAEEGGDP